MEMDITPTTLSLDASSFETFFKWQRCIYRYVTLPLDMLYMLASDLTTISCGVCREVKVIYCQSIKVVPPLSIGKGARCPFSPEYTIYRGLIRVAKTYFCGFKVVLWSAVILYSMMFFHQSLIYVRTCQACCSVKCIIVFVNYAVD
jgi:hypothetical protein